MEVNGPQPDVELLVARAGVRSAVGRLLRGLGGAGGLEALFTTHFRRTTWRLLLLEEKARIEVAFDAGDIVAGSRSSRIREVELELKEGQPWVLFGLARELGESVSFRLGHLSKAARGYAMCRMEGAERAQTAEAVVVRRAQPMGLREGSSVREAFTMVLKECVEQFQENQVGVIGGEAVESVHQMRVGLRRLRGALRVFGRWVRMPEALRKELDWVGGMLGEVRNWEVLGGETLPGLMGGAAGSSNRLEGLRRSVLKEALKQRRELAKALEGVRYARLSLALSEWQCKLAAGVGWEESEVQENASWMSGPLGELWKKVRKRGQRWEEKGGDTEAHRLRIAVKTLRYAVEFFESLLGEKKVARFGARLREVQGAFGSLNDVATARELLEEKARRHQGRREAQQFVLGWFAGKADENRRMLVSAWKALKASSPPWKV